MDWVHENCRKKLRTKIQCINQSSAFNTCCRYLFMIHIYCRVPVVLRWVICRNVWQISIWASCDIRWIKNETSLFSIQYEMSRKSFWVFFIWHVRADRSWGSSVSTVTTDQTTGVRSPSDANICPLASVQTSSEAHPAFCPMGTGDPFPGVKRWPLTTI
jgi:hypothetical protein